MTVDEAVEKIASAKDQVKRQAKAVEIWTARQSEAVYMLARSQDRLAQWTATLEELKLIVDKGLQAQESKQ